MAAQIARLPRKGYLKVIAAQIKSLFHKKVAQIERLLQINGYVIPRLLQINGCKNTKVTSNRLEKYKGYLKVIAAQIQSLF